MRNRGKLSAFRSGMADRRESQWYEDWGPDVGEFEYRADRLLKQRIRPQFATFVAGCDIDPGVCVELRDDGKIYPASNVWREGSRLVRTTGHLGIWPKFRWSHPPFVGVWDGEKVQVSGYCNITAQP